MTPATDHDSGIPEAARATDPVEGVHECHSCGLFQSLGRLRPGQVAACARCGTVLRRRRVDSLTTILALNMAGLCLMVIAVGWPLLTFRLTGQIRTTSLLHLPRAFLDAGMPPLAYAVLLATVVAPFARLSLTVAVVLGLWSGTDRRLLATMERGRETLGAWAMIDVFMLGLLVAYSRLAALASVEAGIAVYALIALMMLNAWSDAWTDRVALWDAIGRQDPPMPPTRTPGPVLSCEACGLVTRHPEGQDCPRCGAVLERRRPFSTARTWALIIAAAVLYIPANLYPVLTVIRLGRGAPSTIIGGVQELVAARMYPLALLVLVASILVPLAKLLGLGTLLIMTQRRSARGLVGRTRLYRLVELVGRWSMIDIFMAALLTALVRMGVIGSVTPGYGAVFFCCVVVLTMVAAITFDPRTMWDAVEAADAAPDRQTSGAVPA